MIFPFNIIISLYFFAVVNLVATNSDAVLFNNELSSSNYYPSYRRSRFLDNKKEKITDDDSTSIDDNAKEDDTQEKVVLISGSYDGCDESKCVSSGRYWEFNYSFTYYFIDEHNFPMMCADGYQPQVIENEPEVYDEFWDITAYYFTCCPPIDLLSFTNTGRHCSNPTTLIDTNNTLVCEDNNRPYPRQMKINDKFDDDESHICCDSIINTSDNNQTTNYLNDIECVPYINRKYDHIRHVQNLFGRIYPIVVNCSDSEIGFQYLNENFECCKTKQRTPYFWNDSKFKATLYPQIFLSSIAVISCIILIVSLLIPLRLHLQVQSAAVNVSASTTRATHRRLRQSAAASTYSSYNLYLVYLAFPDFFLNLYLLGMYGGYANQKYNPQFNGEIIYSVFTDGIDNAFEPAFILSCSTANLYLNCVVSYEILVLLRNSDQFVTHNPPSLLRVTWQAVGVYLFSIIVFIIHYFIRREAIESYTKIEYFDMDGDHYIKYNRLILVNLGWSVVVSYAFPIGYFLYIWITIICRGYLPSVTEKTRQLVWFFFRIVFVFCLIWFPGMFFVVYGMFVRSRTSQGMWLQIGLLFCGLQPTVSTCMTMTKADIKEYTQKVVTLSYIRSSLFKVDEETQPRTA